MATTVVIQGSPREGNSSAIADIIASETKAKGNEVKTFNINKLNAKGCQSCYGCKKAGKCVFKDDMLEVLDAVRNADSIVLATPIYFWQPSSQFRMFEDRCFSFVGADFVPNIAAGKKVAIVVTCNSGLDGAEKVAAMLEEEWGKFFKADVVGKIVEGWLIDPNVAVKNADIIAKAKAIGAKL